MATKPKVKAIIKNKQDASKITYPVVYAIIDILGNIVYVGQTRNLKRRYIGYFYKCHNHSLAKWMLKNKWRMEILAENPNDLDKMEIYFITKHKEKIFNLNYGDNKNWENRDRKPWMAGKKQDCPSDALLTWLRNRKRKKYKVIKTAVDKMKKNMDDTERTLMELSIAKEYLEIYGYYSIKQVMEDWIEKTKDKIIEYLEAA